MLDTLDKLVALLDLETLGPDLFQGNSFDIGTGRVYGGQVLGQALKAAQMTVSGGKSIHSLHAYFLREGNFNLPIQYRVEMTRDGKSFSTRSVTALQRDNPIFITITSFQIAETGLEYQQKMPDVPTPEDLPTLRDLASSGASGPVDRLDSLLRLSTPFDIKPISNRYSGNFSAQPVPRLDAWIRTTHRLADNPDLHRAILAYISDYGLVRTALLPHRTWLENPALQLASLDHGMWFHRPFRMDEWLLYSCEPVTTGSARGLARGSFYDQTGRLVATTMQEGLLRPVKKPG
jgi:acyl-CoA thioesterase-2